MNSVSISVAQPKIAISNPYKSKVFRAWLIWGLATIFYFYDNLLQISPSAMKPELMLAFAKQAEQFGSLSAYCLYAYGLMQIPAGLLLDKYGPRRLITLACILCACGSLLFGVASTLWEAKFGRLLIGVGAAFAFVSCLKIASIWFSANRFAFLIGLTATIGFLGSAFGLSFVSKIIQSIGWRESMQWGGGIGLLLSLFLFILVKDKKESQAPHLNPLTQGEKLEGTTNKEVLQGLLSVIKEKRTWIAAIFGGLMFVPTLAFGGLWGIPFLVEAHGFDRETAGFCVSLIYIGWVFGSPVWGIISDRLGRRNLPMMISSGVTLVITCTILYSDHLSLYVLNGLLFGLGFFSSGFLLAFAVVRESHKPAVAGTAIGFTNALNTFFGAIAQPIIGKILDFTSQHATGGEHVFSLVEYQKAFVSLPICLAIAFCLLFFLKETYCKPVV